MTLIEAQCAGFDAFHDGLLRSDSPFPPKSQEGMCWQIGWVSAYTVALYRLRPWPLEDRAPTYH